MSQQDNGTAIPHTDAIVIGAGFAGIRSLIELDKLGLTAVALEAGTDVGGTWYWNRYPGARTDSESWSYCFPFPEIEQSWDWSERYPGQEEVQRYIAFVADHFDVRRHIRFEQRVASATYDEASNTWAVATQDGSRYSCTYLITCLGHLSVPQLPQFAGMDSYSGEVYSTALWPKEQPDFTGKRVAIIGTGASGIQTIPHVAAQASHLTVFQRTPNYVMPAQNHKLDDAFRQQIKDNYPEVWDKARKHVFGFPLNPAQRVFDTVQTEDERREIFEQGWNDGGFHFVFETFDDLILDQRSNDAAADFIRAKIRETVKDPATADLLSPKGYPYISKRPPSGTNYYETFNRDNVELVDLRRHAIESMTPTGLRTAERGYEFDVVIFATGFDAVTGALHSIEITGRDGLLLSEAWATGPENYLGLATPGFPNMITVCGPQSAYANIPVIIEAVVTWLGKALVFMQEKGHQRLEATPEATAGWVATVDAIFNATLLPAGAEVNSWYLGANTPGKPRRVLFFFGGAAAYLEALDGSVNNDFDGFTFSSLTAGARG